MSTEDRIRDACQRAHGVGYISTLAIQAAAAVADAMVAEAVGELTSKLSVVSEAVMELAKSFAVERQLSASAGACAAEYRKRIDERDVLILTLTGERDMLKERLAKLQGEMM